jgi:hypothetical protein
MRAPRSNDYSSNQFINDIRSLAQPRPSTPRPQNTQIVDISVAVDLIVSNGAGFTNRAQRELDPPRRLRKRPQRSEILQKPAHLTYTDQPIRAD